MAILKIISHGKSNKAKRQLLEYVLNPQKTDTNLCYVSGDYQKDTITPQAVYEDFRRVRRLFGKDKNYNLRAYTHATISFPDTSLPPEDVLGFAKEFIEKVYPNHQVLIATHTDTKHTHAHFVIESVSYTNGKMLHTSKHDLEHAKELCNEMCIERNLHVAEKGVHADGSKIDEGYIISWNKNKYHLLTKQTSKSYMVGLTYAITQCAKKSKTRQEFSEMLEHEYGWCTCWEDSRKHITFSDSHNHKVRNINILKTFGIDISKDSLQKALDENKVKSERTRRKGRAR